MKVSDIKDKLRLACAAGESGLEREVEGCYIGDLMSLAMTGVDEGMVWVTIQTNINVAAVASLSDAACVIIADSAIPDEATVTKANELGLPLLTTEMTAYETAKALASLGI